MSLDNLDSPLPRDEFSRSLRAFRDNPGAVAASSKVETADFYGNAQTWIIDTFRVDGADTVFVQRIDAGGGLRLVFPPAVVRTWASQRDSVSAKVQRRRGHELVAKRLERGDTLGNPDALRKARRNRQQAARKERG